MKNCGNSIFSNNKGGCFFVNLLGLLLSGLRRVDDGDGKKPSGKAEGTGGETEAAEGAAGTVQQIAQYVNYFCVFILVACGILVTFFAVYVGYKLASAEEEGKRKEAKNQLIYSIIGVVGIMIVAALLQNIITDLSVYYKITTELESDVNDKVMEIGDKILDDVYHIVKAVLDVLATAGIVFAVYIGWNLMKAEDEGKRKQAKLQLTYTLAAVVAIVLLNVVSGKVVDALVTMVNS
jgi:heme/copper-type cytochrome/quinol oxidase subunit 2